MITEGKKNSDREGVDKDVNVQLGKVYMHLKGFYSPFFFSIGKAYNPFIPP